MNYLWKFYVEYGRQGELSGMFIATQSEIDGIIGKNIYFGEVLGKHSEIEGVIEECDITKVDVSETTVNELVSTLGFTLSGINPLDYVTDE